MHRLILRRNLSVRPDLKPTAASPDIGDNKYAWRTVTGIDELPAGTLIRDLRGKRCGTVIAVEVDGMDDGQHVVFYTCHTHGVTWAAPIERIRVPADPSRGRTPVTFGSLRFGRRFWASRDPSPLDGLQPDMRKINSYQGETVMEFRITYEKNDIVFVDRARR